MGLILAVVLIVCMLLWLFAALPIPASGPYAIYHPLLAWICVAILCYLVISGGSATFGRLGSLATLGYFG